jgi:hypothetical protein
MPKLTLLYDGEEVICEISKVDRDKLYGYVETIVLDETGEKCQLASLANDGKTIIPKGGTSLAYLSQHGQWLTKADLQAVDKEGVPLEPVQATFKAPVSLEQKVSIDEFLQHDIRLAYLMEAVGGLPFGLQDQLDRGEIFTFPFSYRGGWSEDTAFMLEGDGVPWMLVGTPIEIVYYTNDQPTSLAQEPEDDDDDFLDFGLM